jgi:hypothetical protein
MVRQGAFSGPEQPQANIAVPGLGLGCAAPGLAICVTRVL